MKRIILSFSILLVLGFFVARHYAERNRQAGNVRDDAQWFVASLRIGNERAVANYLARSKMNAQKLEKAMKTHFHSLLSTDFEAAPVSFRADGSKLFATFECEEQTRLTFYTENDGETWWIAEIGSR